MFKGLKVHDRYCIPVQKLINHPKLYSPRDLFPSPRLCYRRGYRFHNCIVFLDRLELLPIAALLPAGLIPPLLLALAWPRHRLFAFLLPALALLLEAVSLLRSRRPGRSPSPFGGPFALFALGHGLAAALPLLLSRPPAMVGLHLLLQLGLLAAMLYGFHVEPYQVRLRREEVTLGPGQRRLKLLLLTDLHLDVPGPREDAVLRLARSFAPDLILIPGDLTSLSAVNYQPSARDAIQLLTQLRSLAPVYVSRGTAEVDEEAWVRSIVGPAGAVLLDNERMWVRVGEVGLTLVGIVAAGPLEEHRQKLLELIAGAGESRPPMTGEDGSPEPRRDSGPIILLYHDPDLAEAAAKAGIGLYLAGHTHGGQVRLPLIGPLFTNSRYGRRFAAGRFGLGAMTLIVSRGIGLEGAGAPRLRFLCPPEVVAITVTL